MALFKTKSEKDRDNELKIAILNYLNDKNFVRINNVLPNDNNPEPIFEKIFKYIKSL